MRRVTAFTAALGLCALLTSGCYTVLKSPYAASEVREREPAYGSRYDEGPNGDLHSPRIGRFDDRDNPYGGYPGSGYGSPGGTPLFGYDSRYGPYGLYSFGSGYGSPNYSSGLGPYGYGYDPYYQGDGGVYIPPGYELVTTQELDQLRAGDSGVLTNLEPVVQPTAAEVRALEQKQQAEDGYVWGQRDARSRSAAPGVRARTTGSGSGGSTAVKSAPKGAAKSSSESSAGSKKRAPRKRRR